MKRVAGRYPPLSLSGVSDQVLQSLEIDRTGNDVFADYETRRPVNFERFGESKISFQRLVDSPAPPYRASGGRDVEPDRTGDLINHPVGDLALGPHHGGMEGLVLAL